MRKRGNKINHVRRRPGLIIKAFGGQSPMPRERAQRLGTSFHMALDMLRSGRGRDHDMQELARALNMSMALCESGLGQEYLSMIQAALTNLVRCAAMSHDAGRWLIDDIAYGLICDVLILHEQQMEQASHAEIEEATVVVTERRMKGEVIQPRSSVGID